MTKREQMELAGEVERRVDALAEISGSISAATLLPASGDLGDGVALQQDLMQLELVRDEQRTGSELETGSQLWRVSARLMAATPGVAVDYLVSRERLRQAVNPVIASLPAARLAGPRAPRTRRTTRRRLGLPPLPRQRRRRRGASRRIARGIARRAA